MDLEATIVNYKDKEERILKFMRAVKVAVSRYAIMKGTGIPYNPLKLVILVLVDKDIIHEIKTTGTTFYKMKEESIKPPSDLGVRSHE